jgi:hypothetical protein
MWKVDSDGMMVPPFEVARFGVIAVGDVDKS